MDYDANRLLKDASANMAALDVEDDLEETVFQLEMAQARLVSMEAGFGTMLKWFGGVAVIGFWVVLGAVAACIWTRLEMDAEHVSRVDDIAIPVGSVAAMAVTFCLFKAIELGVMRTKLKTERVGVDLAVVRGRRLVKDESQKGGAA
jgi:hypothetical protein